LHIWLMLYRSSDGTLSSNILMPRSFVAGLNMAILQVHFMERAEFDARNLMHSMPVTLTKAIPILCYTLRAKT